jgi:beta-lactamase superfamily II metal-dependent hydrolase
MLTLHIIQAEYGDCFILEFGTSLNPKYILIDGGPEDIYKDHLRIELEKIRNAQGKLDLVIVSHVDNDHIIGLLDLMAELEEEHVDGKPLTIEVDGLWHNTFNQTIRSGNDIGARLKTLLANARAAGHTMKVAAATVDGIEEGHKLRLAAMKVGIPINDGVTRKHISADEETNPLSLDNLKVYIMGPTEENLETLRGKWLEWLETYEDDIAGGDPSVAANADTSIPNRSSIMVMAEAEGKKILLTGDGRSDHLIQGLEQINLLNPQGMMHVDVLKVPHHGSDRNVTKKFFETVTADTYVISANGKHGNPDLTTLSWIVKAAKKQDRTIKIVVTNQTPSTQKLVEDYDPDEYGYHLILMDEGSHAMVLTVGSHV